MPKYPSRTGDEGYTGFLGEGRLPKHDLRIEAIGVLDEANAALGIARAASLIKESKEVILIAQRDLYGIMSEVAASKENAVNFRKVDASRVQWIDKLVEDLGPVIPIRTQFIVPGDSLSGAMMDLARTIVRRAERRITELFHQGLLENQELIRYLNRLSSLCFLLELLENSTSGNQKPTFAKVDPKP
jgi:cob(I)alamin adenosyltransferase